MPPDAAPFVLIHEACGKPAIRLTYRPEPQSPIILEMFRHLDGSMVKQGEPAICGGCGLPVYRPFRTKDIRDAA